ncbi:hypothetical protein OVS_01070 [Mycoplasma ovis str. Michigan]|uniref:Uncharacterized protein n=1 Tax=Mycoplasma ovis str. Michigan TaxID=1415773 RepID=A0ABM5P1A5_9MOLU|nr:hypothetical protein [Mycoplasma ovis]AHC40175.1 hypothetical protein OVS_01070 [Mycoplasma ovis str. Michigan]
MSFPAKVLKGFFGIGGIGTIPLLEMNPLKKEINQEIKDLLPPPQNLLRRQFLFLLLTNY